MKALAPVIGLAGLLPFTAPAGAEQLTVALSAPRIEISSNFTGAPMTVFGVIERDATTISRRGDYQLAVVVFGPPQSVVARRKDRILGIWANSASETFFAAPSFYTVATTTREIEQLANEPVLDRLGLGFDNLGFNTPGAEEESAAEFRQAFLRIKRNAGLYAEQIGGVHFIGDSIFRATIWVPANAPVGKYRVAVFLFADGVLRGQTEQVFSIAKTGFEQFMFVFARQQSFVYGAISVALALFTGWLAGVIFRKD